MKTLPHFPACGSLPRGSICQRRETESEQQGLGGYTDALVGRETGREAMARY